MVSSSASRASRSSHASAASRGPAKHDTQWGELEGSAAHNPCARINQFFPLNKLDPARFLSADMMPKDMFPLCPFEVVMKGDDHRTIRRSWRECTQRALPFMGWPPEVTRRVEENLLTLFPDNDEKTTGPTRLGEAQVFSFNKLLGMLRFQCVVAAVHLAIEKSPPKFPEQPFTFKSRKEAEAVPMPPGMVVVQVRADEEDPLSWGCIIVRPGFEDGHMVCDLRCWNLEVVETTGSFLMKKEKKGVVAHDAPRLRLFPGYRMMALTEYLDPVSNWVNGTQVQVVWNDKTPATKGIFVGSLIGKEWLDKETEDSQKQKIKFG